MAIFFNVFQNLDWYFLRLELWRNVTQRKGEHGGLFITKLLLAQRHRWRVKHQRIFASFINAFVYFIPIQWFARFIKHDLLPKLSAIRTLPLCRSLCLRHLRDIVFMLSPPCSPSLCVTFICSRLTLSLHISEKFFFIHPPKQKPFHN